MMNYENKMLSDKIVIFEVVLGTDYLQMELHGHEHFLKYLISGLVSLGFWASYFLKQ